MHTEILAILAVVSIEKVFFFIFNVIRCQGPRTGETIISFCSRVYTPVSSQLSKGRTAIETFHRRHDFLREMFITNGIRDRIRDYNIVITLFEVMTDFYSSSQNTSNVNNIIVVVTSRHEKPSRRMISDFFFFFNSLLS